MTMIFFTAFDGPGVLPDKADPTDPQIPPPLNPAEGHNDDDDDDDNDGNGVDDDYDRKVPLKR